MEDECEECGHYCPDGCECTNEGGCLECDCNFVNPFDEEKE